MPFQDHMLLWNHAALRVLDVRHAVIEPGGRLRSYRLPANVFLFAPRGKARVLLDGTEYAADKCFVCHAGKGAYLDVVQVTEAFEYFMVYYNAVLTLPCRRELVRLYKESSPFQLQYGLTPQYPIPLFNTIEQMDREWQQGGPLQKFRVKGLFHQFVYELLGQLQAQGGQTARPNAAAQAVRYIDEHYAEPITLHSLAALFHCSVRQLQRLFKARLQMGPMDYLIEVRMQKAQAMLRHTDASLPHIAESVGYTDSYYFSRMFKKYTGVSPLHFKERARPAAGTRRLNPSRLSRFPIGAGRPRLYSRIDDENHYQYKDGGITPMYKNFIAMPTVGFMLALLLLLGACSSAATSSAGAGGGGASQVAPQSAASGSADSQGAAKLSSPVTIKHMKGEVTLERRPEKTAVLDAQFVDQLIALNEKPAGTVITTADKEQFPDYLSDKLGDVKVLGTKDEPNLEAIIAMEPDFIICTEFQEKIYDSLVKIAPTIMMDRNEDWRDSLTTLGKMFGKEKEAEKVRNDYDQKVGKLKAELTAKLNGQTVALIRPRDNNIRLHTTTHRTASILYKDLGLTPPKQAVNDKDTSMMITLEALTEVNADHMFFLTDDQFQRLAEQFQSTAVWKNLKAVKENHVYPVNATLWIGYYGPIAMNMVVDQIAKAFNVELKL
ncbi:putative siderophore-binding lipoprotein YfiY precursor [Paenibacillus konkukensis]|uniref:Siderophore-binding lipoprotein YfiY n=1 Tax=Paenibacillus konkukensis TaxID=2020716 RepID=A0ABY4RSU7_9BACL|nr:AraC family transcriptional regulator [Paenibacillus konkukensis]UQZ85651.1 putative siderophore-binding lipoprotein YfiY precursor [Paenibacillus konkukensis]